ncbi:MAG: DUF3596 domain-containing protein [Cyanobacteria bacterium J06635_1]
MDSGRQSSRAPKGSVKVIVSHDRLQLRFRYGGKRRYLSLGLPDTPVNHKVAEARARLIELDIISGNFDSTLAKYRLPADTEGSSQDKAKPNLWELWERFVEYKEAQCRENTMRHTYAVYTNYAKSLPTYDLERAAEIRDYALKQFPLDAAKRFITRLSACCEFAKTSGWIETNPFVGMAADIKGYD